MQVQRITEQDQRIRKATSNGSFESDEDPHIHTADTPIKKLPPTLTRPAQYTIDPQNQPPQKD
jgi:hypothetical protein